MTKNDNENAAWAMIILGIIGIFFGTGVGLYSGDTVGKVIGAGLIGGSVGFLLPLIIALFSP